MQFKLDLISQSLRPEYEALRENLKQIRSQCLDESPLYLNSWRDAIHYPQKRKLSLANSSHNSVNYDANEDCRPMSVMPMENEMLMPSPTINKIAVIGSTGFASNANDMAKDDDSENQELSEQKALDEQQRRREFGQKLLEIMASEEFNRYQQRFNVPSDLESVLATLTSDSIPYENLSAEDKKIRQDLEKLFYEVVRSPECEHYKTIVREKSPSFDNACREREARKSLQAHGTQQNEDRVSNGNNLLVTQGLAKLCEPFCPTVDKTSQPLENANVSVLASTSRHSQIIAPFLDCLLLLVVPEISMEIF